MQQEKIPPAFAAILANVDRLVINQEQRLQADLGIDSLSMIDVACATEDAPGIRIPDEDLEGFRTVGDGVDTSGAPGLSFKVEAPRLKQRRRLFERCLPDRLNRRILHHFQAVEHAVQLLPPGCHRRDELGCGSLAMAKIG